MKFKKIIILSLIVFGVINACKTATLVTEDGRRIYSQVKDERLEKEKIIEGYVHDSKTDEPIKNATVELKNVNLGIGYYIVKTNNSGYYKIKDFITHVNYKMDVTAEGYVPYSLTGKIYSGKYNIELDPEAFIKGKVIDSNGRGMPNVEITLKKRRYDKPVIVSTDSSGNYQFNKLAAGRYILNFKKGGYISETAKIKYIKVGESFNLTMNMYQPASISGNVSIRDLDTPAININIIAQGKFRHAVLTYYDGNYQINDLKPGEYIIQVLHQGFHPLKSETFYIKEGIKKKLNFSITAKKPELNIYTYRYTFAPGDKLSFNLRTFRLEKIKATVYKVPLNTFLKGNSDPNNLNPEDEKFKTAVQWEEPIHNFKPYEWKYQTLNIKDPLPTGGYCIEVEGAGKIINRKFFTVTSTGVVVKRSQYSIFAYVTNLITNKPISNAAVVIFDSTPKEKKYQKYTRPYKPPKRIEDLPVKIVHKGKTDKNGIHKYKIKSAKHLSVFAIGNDNSYAICSTGSPIAFEREKNKYFIYTDRPVYRSGDTVNFKIIGKSRKQRFVPIANQKLFYKIRNRDRRKTIKEGGIKLDSWGTANSKVEIKSLAGLGEFEIRAGPEEQNLYAVGRFYVEQYRKPEFKIEIAPAKDYYINGDTAKFRVEAKYFFGAPLKGAVVKYRFYETRLRDTDTKYWWEDDYPTQGSYNRIKLEGDKFLDDNGVTALRLDAGVYPYDREITLEATVIDRTNISITARKKVKIGRGEYYIKINPKKNFFADNEKKKVEIKTLKHTEKPYSAKLEVKLFRYIWKPYQRVYVHDKKPVFATSVRTDSNGIGIIELPKKIPFYGEFDLIINGKDSRNNNITASRVIWIYSKHGGPIASKFKNLEISVDKTSLKKAEDITCLIKSRFSDAYVCLTLEGRDVYYSKVVKLTGNITPVTIPVKYAYAPNFYLTATMQRRRALFTYMQNISIPIFDTELNITLNMDKDKYLPGEKAVVKIQARDKGNKPVETDLSLSAVDESIYYIRSDHTPKMKNYFYTKISNWVLTSYSYPINILAGAGKEGKIKIRSDFKDTAFWQANIKTNKKGEASVSFKLPDNLTTWRVTVRGHDRIGRVGEKISKFLVTQDLIARIGKPRFFIEGDRLSIIGAVNSNTKRGLPDVRTKMLVNDKKIEPDTKTKISLPAFGSAKNYYTFNVPEKINSLDIQYEARADKEAKDGLLISVPVSRRGAAYNLYGIGDMINNKKVVLTPLKETEDFQFVPEKVRISLNPSPVIQMIKATDFLLKYPYGCVEQTINRFFPLLAIQQLLKNEEIEYLIPNEKLKNLSHKTITGIKKIARIQNDDGSWGWWRGDRGNEYITGYVMHALFICREYGYSVDKRSITKGLDAVKRMLDNMTGEEENNYDACSFLLFVYSLYEKWHEKAFEKIIDEDELNTYQMAFLLRALASYNPEKVITQIKANRSKDDIKQRIQKANTGRKELIKKLHHDIKQKMKKDGKGVYWASSGYQSWGWPGASVEITAHVLSALVESDDKTTLPAQIVKSLSKRSQGSSWVTTKQTASVILAICEFLKKNKISIGEDADISFTMDGKKLARFKFDPEMIKNTDDLEQELLLEGFDPKKEVVITANGKGGGDVNFDIVVSGTLYFKPGTFLSIFKSEGRSLSALSNGINIYRTYTGVTRVKDTRNQEYMALRSIPDKKIKIGDEFLVKLRFVAYDNFEYLVMEDFLPSGFEVIKKNAYDRHKPFVHSERWDNRMVFFFNNLLKGKIYEVAYTIRAELPGGFFVRPAKMECMYEPSIQGWGAPLDVDVNKKETE